MDVIGSEIGLKMRSAIRAKLTELGCYVDDELPDYVMVMVANKRTRPQMEEDLHLFLASNTTSFVAWLYQVLRKLQEVTITTPPEEPRANSKDRTRSTSKEPKVKESKKKLKDKKIKTKEKFKKNDTSKKSKKKNKEKEYQRKSEKKSHKHKKKSKETEMIRPNVPPLLMNLERESEPSITDVFAGQILKNHGENLSHLKDIKSKQKEKQVDTPEVKRPILPIIDPATISAAPIETMSVNNNQSPVEANKETMEPQQEINKIEDKIQDLRMKLAKQLSSMSDDEDFLNLRAGIDELIPELEEDVFQDKSTRSIDIQTPPLNKEVRAIQTATPINSICQSEQLDPKSQCQEEPLQIELCLPKRSVRERLGLREELKVDSKNNTADKHSEIKQDKHANDKDDYRKRKSSSSSRAEPLRKSSERSTKQSIIDTAKKDWKKLSSLDSKVDKSDLTTKRKSPSPERRASPASVVQVRARARARGPASQLLFRAVADAQKSLLNIPPKVEKEVQRGKGSASSGCGEAQRLQIRVSRARGERSVVRPPAAAGGATVVVRLDIKQKEKSEYVPAPLTTPFTHAGYVPSLVADDAEADGDGAIVNRADIHNAKVASEEGPVFLVTLEGLDPNQFLSKKLQSEGIDDGPLLSKIKNKRPSADKYVPVVDPKPKEEKSESSRSSEKKRLSDTSEESDTQVLIKPDDKAAAEKRKSEEKREKVELKETIKTEKADEATPAKKRRARSPIVFDVGERERGERPIRARDRTVSNGSDSTVVTTPSTSKYDSIPSLSTAAERKATCRSFPMCRFGAKCAFAHPACKFALACTRRNCPYSHQTAPQPPAPANYIASHVIPAPNYKSITAAAAVAPGMCKYYPNCGNAACAFYHPKPCRFGMACVNKTECNYYHHDSAATKWRSAV